MYFLSHGCGFTEIHKMHLLFWYPESGSLTRPLEDLVYAKNVLVLKIQSQMAWYVEIWEDSQQQKLVESNYHGFSTIGSTTASADPVEESKNCPQTSNNAFPSVDYALIFIITTSILIPKSWKWGPNLPAVNVVSLVVYYSQMWTDTLVTKNNCSLFTSFCSFHRTNWHLKCLPEALVKISI